MEDDSPSEQLKDQPDQDRVRLLEALVIAENDLAEGRILTHEQVKAKLAKWLK